MLSSSFQALVRGADGIGESGIWPGWDQIGNTRGMPDDSRLAYRGLDSIRRTLHGLLRQYGPWLVALKTQDE
jgi:hypothetical protein